MLAKARAGALTGCA